MFVGRKEVRPARAIETSRKGPGQRDSAGWESSHALGGPWLDSRSGHTLRWWVSPLVAVKAGKGGIAHR